MAVNIGPKIGIDGESEYRKQISAIAKETKLLNSEMKALSTSFDSNGKSLKQNAEQHKILSEQIKNQEARVEAAKNMVAKATTAYEENKKQLELAKAAYGENSTEVQNFEKAVESNSQKIQKYQTDLNNATADLNKLKSQLDQMPSSLDLVAQKFEAMGKKLESVGQGMEKLGSKLTSTVTAGVGAAFTASIKSAIDWESAFTGVMKTVDETATTTYADLEKSIMQMATETASSKEDIAAVAEAAGQLGVSADDIEGFTRTMVMLGDTTNLSADEAASALAKFTNITGSGNANVDRLGAAIVALGNNFATTESDIVEMSTRLASAGTLAGMSETDILALSTAMSSVGIQAEAGGTAMTQTLTALESAVSAFRAGSTDDLEAIADVAGLSADDFAKAWESHPIGAVQDFIQGLGDLDEKGESATLILDELGMSGVRQSNMLKSLALASETLGNAVDTAGTAYSDNTALAEEAEKRYATFEAKISQLKESLTNLAVTFGNDLLPYVQKAIDFVQGLIDKFSSFDEEERAQIIQIAAIAAAIGPLLVTGGKLLTGIGKIMQFAPQISTALSGVSSVFGGLSTSLAGLLAPIAAIVAVIGVLVAAFMNLWNNNEAFRTNMIATWESIKASFAGFIAQVQERLPAIQAAFTSFIEFVRPLWEAFYQILAPMFESAFSMVATVLQTVFNVIISVIDMLLGIFTADKELFMTGLTEFLTAIVTFLTTMLNLIWTTILNVINVILSFFGTSLATLKTNITTAFTNIVTSVREKITEFRDLIFEKIGEVVDYIAELPGKFLQWGTDMINNLIAGIRSGIDAVGEAVSAVADKISSFLHFSEPDVGPLANFNSWMPDMMKQMADQIEAGRLQVQLAASHVAADIAAPMESAQNFTLNNSFTFNGGYTEAEGREIVRRINRELGALYI